MSVTMPKSATLRSCLMGASLGVIASVCLSMSATAQTAPTTPAPAEKPKPTTTTPVPTTPAPPAEGTPDAGTVTVVGEKPAVQNKIDRDVYDVTKDPDAATGTAADVLNKVPAVNVDADGNISLRGNQGVQVLLNGRTTPALEGDSRGTTLQSLNADDIESIEVITNPSAQFQGGGNGIINIVLKKNRRLGKSGGIRASYGSSGRYNLGGQLNDSGSMWSFNGGANIRHNVNKSVSDNYSERTEPISGVKTTSNSHSINSSRQDSKSVQGGVEYNPNEFDTFGVNFRYNGNESSGPSSSQNTNYNAAQTITSQYVQVSNPDRTQDNISVAANYEHRTSLPGETLKIDYRHNESNSKNDNSSTYYYSLPSTSIRRDMSRSENDSASDQLGVSYVRPFEDGSKIALGADYEVRDETADNYRATIDPVTGALIVNVTQTNQFKAKSTFQSAYVTYEHYFGPNWGILPGLRVDGTQFDLYSVTQGLKAQNNYTRLSPSLTILHKVDDFSKINFSYSLKYQRPDTRDLNPFVTYRDPQNVSSGNSNLMPTVIETYEVKYTHNKQSLNYSASLYYRHFSDTIDSVSYFIPNPSCTPSTITCDLVLLSTRDNVGDSKSAGLSFSVNYRFSPKLNVSFNPNFQYTERTNTNAFLVGQTSGNSVNGNGNVNYRPTTKDSFQLQYSFRGDTVTTQGTQSGSQNFDLTYSRTVTPKISMNLQLRDIFNGQKSDSTSTTLTGFRRSHRETEGQVVFVSLNYRLGNVRANSNQGQNQGRYGGGNRGGGEGGGMGGGGGQTNPGGGLY